MIVATLFQPVILSPFNHLFVFRAGGIIPSLNGVDFVPAPPLSVLGDQNLIETASRTSDGEKMKQAHTEQELFGICCSVGDEGLTLYGLDVTVQLDTPTSGKSLWRTCWLR